jgi:hypothetical protein
MNDEMTLGEILRARARRAEAAAQDRLARAADDKKALARQELLQVELFFEEAKKHFENNIRKGWLLQPVRLGGGHNAHVCNILEVHHWGARERRIDHSRHRHHAVWREFVRWAEANALLPVLRCEWRELETCYLLSVEAL